MPATDTSLYTQVYNHLLERIEGIAAPVVDFDNNSGRAQVSHETVKPGGIEVGAGDSTWVESNFRQGGVVLERDEWGWSADFSFTRPVDTTAVEEALAVDVLVPRDITNDIPPFRVLLDSMEVDEGPRQQGTGPVFRADFTVHLLRK